MKQRSLLARVSYAASTALLALLAAAAPASANDCATAGGWRAGGNHVTIRANVADVSDGWKVAARKYTAKSSDNKNPRAEDSKNGILTLSTDDQALWGGKGLMWNDHEHPMVNLFEATFQAADGTTVACSITLQGHGNSYKSEYKFKSASCSGPDSNKDYVTCRRQYRDGIDQFRVYLTLNDLD